MELYNNSNNDKYFINDTDDSLPSISRCAKIKGTFNFAASYIYSAMFNVRKIREIPTTCDTYDTYKTNKILHAGTYVKYCIHNLIKCIPCVKNILLPTQQKYFVLYKSHSREFTTVIMCSAYDIKTILNEIKTCKSKFKQIILNKPTTMIVKIILTTDGNNCDITHMLNGIVKHKCDIFITDILIGYNVSYNTNSFITVELYHNFINVIKKMHLTTILDKDITKIFII